MHIERKLTIRERRLLIEATRELYSAALAIASLYTKAEWNGVMNLMLNLYYEFMGLSEAEARRVIFASDNPRRYLLSYFLPRGLVSHPEENNQ